MLFFWGCVLLLRFITSFISKSEKWNDELVREAHETDRKPNIDRVLVEVYYESMCIDSKYFIRQQLVPVMKRIPEYIDLRLIPYGKARTIENSTGIFFTCQHYKEECQGNKIHACAIKYIEGKSKQLGFASCLINNIRNPQSSGEKVYDDSCAAEVSTNWEQIQVCSNSKEGSELLKAYGEETHNLYPSLTFVPTVALNKSKGNQRNILKSLFKEICSLYTGTKPLPCLRL